MSELIEKASLDSWVVSVTVPLLLAGILCYLNILWYKNRNKKKSQLPPWCLLSLKDRRALYLKGIIHHRYLEESKKLGPVYQISLPLQWAPHFVVCDATLGRLILEGNNSKQIEGGEKRPVIKLFDKMTMNKPSILTKKTHGEDWGEF
jgi:hypothetical protein